MLCLLIPYFCFSKTISETDTCSTDTLYSITQEQLRATVKIFAEHSFLLSENKLLNDRISLLNRSGRAKDNIIQSQNEQIGVLSSILIKNDIIIKNSDAIIENLKAQIAAERNDRKKYVLFGAGVGATVVGVLVVTLK